VTAAASMPSRRATNVVDLDTPVVLIDVERLQKNLKGMAERVAQAGGGRVRLRPHAKTHKTRQIAMRQLELGAIGLTVAKVGEAEAMVGAGVEDLLIAYPVLGDQKYERMLPLLRKARIRIAIDSLDVAEAASAFFAPHGIKLPVLIEIDTGFGRTGVQSPSEALQLADQIDELPGVEVAGVMCFGGQAYQTAEAGEQTEIGRSEGQVSVQVANLLAAHNHKAQSVSVGSTPTAVAAAGVTGVTEVRPGVYAFGDLKQVQLGTVKFEDCALTVLATVVSHPRPERYVVDAGLKTFAGENYGWGTYGRLLDHPDLIVDWAAEEHGVILLPEGSVDPKLRIGDKVRIVPDHACGTVNMHDELIAIDGDAVVDVWPVIGRGRVR
jgi:D-serine deaminase-like pyridoxal phosphate-dependent protein